MKAYYFKTHQRDGIWHYYKLLNDRLPPARETVNFLNDRPQIDFSEFDLNSPGSKIDYDALWEVGERIKAIEYDAAYQRATATDVGLYINGKLQKLAQP